MKLKIFENEEFGKIRTLNENGVILFCAMDVASELGYSNSRKAILDHCKGVTKRDTLTGGGSQKLTFINEADVYRLIFKSKLPAAEKFEKWIMEEVLPALRREGAYLGNLKPKQLLELLLKKVDAEQLIRLLVNVVDEERYAGRLTDIDDTARILGLKIKDFKKLLVRMRWMYKKNNMYVPYAVKQNSGYIIHKEYSTKSKRVFPHFTLKGRVHLFLKLIENFELCNTSHNLKILGSEIEQTEQMMLESWQRS